MAVEVLEQLYEGKAKKVFKTSDDALYMVEYKDDATAFNGEKRGTIEGKGVINNKMSAMLFKELEKQGIETHLVEFVDDTHQLVKRVEIVPLEVIARNVIAGSLPSVLVVLKGKCCLSQSSNSLIRTTISAIQ